MTKWKIYNEDVTSWAKRYNKSKFHALLCDPPYELNFMNKKWDNSGIAFDPDTWAAFGEVLYPGAFGMAFSSSRSWHRLAVAIEDAGFVIHPTIFLWSYGSGFPKATRIDNQIDKAAGIKQDVIGQVKGMGKQNPEWNGTAKGRKENSFKPEYNQTIPATDLAKAFQGHRYGLQALKPATEPIIVFQKPYEGKPIDNIVETGAGALNIDGGRVGLGGMEEHKTLAKSGLGKHGVYGKSTVEEITGKDLVRYTSSGRWPANFILDEEAAKHLDKQSGISISGKGTPPSVPNNPIKFQASATVNHIGHSDSGGASRFFYTVSSQLDESDPVYYCSKASGKEREAGLEDFERKEVKTHGEMGVDLSGNNHNTTGQVPAKRANIHPTCKPIDLARYLATLLLPPIDYAPRRILVPFSGVASEMIGCGLAGWEQIVGVEFDKENGYIDIANARLEHWLNK